MKKPWLAFVLSFLVPGAGLMYLGRWAAGLVNLALVTAIMVGVALVQQEAFFSYAHYLALTLAAGSAGLAHALCARRNLEIERGGRL